MKLIRHLESINNHQQCAITIGNFDGVHRGHQALLKQLITKAKADNLLTVVISFKPSPKEFFGKKQAQITSFNEKFKLLQAQGIDEYLLLNFNEDFANITAENFIVNILIKKLNVKYIVIGDDFRFGKNRTGNITLLQLFAYKNNFTIDVLNALNDNNTRISSSNIRLELAKGNFNTVNNMLGRQFTISAKVIHGNKKGKEIGYPTINIPIKRKISPILGIFAVFVIINNTRYQGVASIGFRPIINGNKVILEVFIFNFDKTIYGKYAKVEFCYKIRNEENFINFEQLKLKIAEDVIIAKEYFNNEN